MVAAMEDGPPYQGQGHFLATSAPNNISRIFVATLKEGSLASVTAAAYESGGGSCCKKCEKLPISKRSYHQRKVFSGGIRLLWKYKK